MKQIFKKTQRTLLLALAVLMLISNTSIFAKSEEKYGPDTKEYWEKMTISEVEEIIKEEKDLPGKKTYIIFPMVGYMYYQNKNSDRIDKMTMYMDSDAFAMFGKLVEAEELENFYRIETKRRDIYIPIPDIVSFNKMEVKSSEIVTTYAGEEAEEQRRYVFSRIKKNPEKPQFIKDEIGTFKESLNEDSTFEEIMLALVNSWDRLNILYGGDSYKQFELGDRKTMCMGFTWITEEFLMKTNLKYRFATESGNKLKANSYAHIRLEVFNPQDESWYDIEPTRFSSANLEKYRKKFNEKWQGAFLDDILKYDKVETIPIDKMVFVPNKAEQIYEEVFLITEEYQNGWKIGNVGYKIRKYGYKEEKKMNKLEKEAVLEYERLKKS